MLAYLRDGSDQTILNAATPRWKLQIKLSISPNHSLYTDTRPTCLSADPVTPGTGQGSHWITIFQVAGMIWCGKRSMPKACCSAGLILGKAFKLGAFVCSISGALHQGLVPWRLMFVKWRQSSQSNRHSTTGTRQTKYHEALPSSANDELRCDCTFANFGHASWYSVCRVPMVE